MCCEQWHHVHVCVCNIAYTYIYTASLKKQNSTFYHNLGKWRLTYKILSLTDSWGILYTHIIRILHLTLNLFLRYLVKLEKLQLLLILMAYCMWDLRIHLARDEAALLAQTWILWLWNLENNAAVLRRGSVMSANWSSGWLTCNMGCIRQSLMKLTPVNGVNVCELVFVSEMDVFITCFNCRTIDDQV